MRQQIMRNNFDRPEVEKGVEERSLRLSPVSLKAIVDAIGNLDIASSQRLCEQATIDDAAMVCITIPTRGFSQCLPLFAFEGYHKRGLLPANSVVGYKSFRDVWDAIDSVSPYSLREHWK